MSLCVANERSLFIPPYYGEPVSAQTEGGKRRKRLMQEKRGETTIVSFHIPPQLLKAVDELVEKGVFSSRSEAFRIAIVLLLRDLDRLGRERPEVGYR
jgi:hypothetical protein